MKIRRSQSRIVVDVFSDSKIYLVFILTVIITGGSQTEGRLRLNQFIILSGLIDNFWAHRMSFVMGSTFYGMVHVFRVPRNLRDDSEVLCHYRRIYGEYHV